MDHNPSLEDLEFVGEALSTTQKDIGTDEIPEVLAYKEEDNWGNLDEIEAHSRRLKNKRYEDDTRHRRVMSQWAGTVVSVWLIAVILILVGNTYRYKLSDSVLITLLTTTTVNVLGLMIIVLNDFFRAGGKVKFQK